MVAKGKALLSPGAFLSINRKTFGLQYHIIQSVAFGWSDILSGIKGKAIAKRGSLPRLIMWH